MAEIHIRAVAFQPVVSTRRPDGTVRDLFIGNSITHLLRVSTWDHTGYADWRVIAQWNDVP